MGLCELDSDNVVFVTATYLIGVIPWVPWDKIPFWEPIDRNWTPYYIAFAKSWIFLFASIVPYCVLIPYAVLQGCSKDPDVKEVFTAIVVMVANLWKLHQALRGLLALREIRLIWEQINIREVALAFADWLPEEYPTDYKNITPSLEFFKLPLVDLLISDSLVDNAWPGNAPQTAYIYRPSLPQRTYVYFPDLRAVDSEVLQKQ